MTMPQLTFELPDTVVVTGASSGLGHELCSLLVEAGVATVGVDLAAAQDNLAALAGYRHVAGDVAGEATWEKVVARLRSSGAKRIGLVTSAAILDVGTILEATPAIMSRALNVNIVGTALAIKFLLPLMIEAHDGTIVVVASVNATLAEQQLGIYNATKAAVRQLARTVALDHSRSGVRANVLSPGPMLAGLFKRHLESATDSDKFLATRSARQPGGRILEAREVAPAAMFLLSSGSTAVLGADLVADGGLTASFDFRTGEERASI
ncbi:SDR family oxidoreductase (plasmid) [Rhizobium ruizarguesonis]|nr:SDR family oxidoreductase [Rhizobium ruizarguesonis]TAY09777.1 SDR family oxidoreductase [Rhizobium ruizarguesonis]TAY29798.1 SDR family oxidoreductase [Rhizobium ruizarguesonis]TAY42111.1 SDR family oxidoreductase [Rhizobium ruizarguesonis]TBA73514.1 SDR family oxidoreductase [Rhizobium ruizarguesonis]